MGFSHFALVVVVTLLVSCETLSESIHSDQAKLSTATSSVFPSSSTAANPGRRFLRADKIPDQDADFSAEGTHQTLDDDTTEERLFSSLSAFSKKVATSMKNKAVGRSVNIKLFAAAEKSPVAVKNVLGLGKLSTSAAKAHPNYKYYEEVAEIQLAKWLNFDLSTGDVWRKFGLDKMPLATAEKSIDYGFYQQYVKLFDAELIREAKLRSGWRYSDEEFAKIFRAAS
ncbi:hypothetical protein PHYBOEH_006904 [Phytophthora boehmeriae]|uniref:RxLR effector protein n=1 Tax=Phytophthora boehmeriae TaxID=109152 RepID=A0A8T1WBX3_9STRA|nr:hypothetical protein PHYBOEH_006904 [Phytophthora boehmeriae]